MSDRTRKVLWWFAVSMAGLLVYRLLTGPQDTGAQQMTYTKFLQAVEQGRVSQVFLTGDGSGYDIDAMPSAGSGGRIHARAPMDPGFVPMLRERNVEISVRAARTTLMSSLLSWLPMLVVIGLWMLITRRPTGRGAAA